MNRLGVAAIFVLFAGVVFVVSRPEVSDQSETVTTLTQEEATPTEVAASSGRGPASVPQPTNGAPNLSAATAASKAPQISDEETPPAELLVKLRADGLEAIQDRRLAAEELDIFVESRLARWREEVEESREMLSQDDFQVTSENEQSSGSVE